MPTSSLSTASLYRLEELEALLAAPDASEAAGAAVEPLPVVDEPVTGAGLGALGIALLSALAFSTSGTFAKSLLDAGWTSGAAVTVRVLGAAAVLTVPAVLALRGRWGALRRNAGTVLGYGLVAIAASQLAYFSAVDHLSVGVALLLEYFSPVLLVGYLWARTRRAPAPTTLLGAALATGGLALVIDLFGGLDVDLVGLAWGLAAACCAVAYYVLGARPAQGLPPIALAWSGMTVGGLALAAAGVLGVVPLAATTGDVVLAGHRVPVVVPVLGLTVVAGAVSYSTGIAAARRLGSTVASFASLTEIVFALAVALVLLGEVPTHGQLLGAVLVLAGVATVKLGESRA